MQNPESAPQPNVAAPAQGQPMMARSGADLVYLFDIPKDISSKEICEYFKTKIGENQPQIKRRSDRLFYMAIIRFTDPADVQKCIEKERFPEFKGHEYRLLPFDKDIKNQANAAACNLFVGKIPKEGVSHKKLFDLFSEKGQVKSVKISRDGDYNMNGYGFVSFTNPEDAEKARAELDNHEIIEGEKLAVSKYIPKERRAETANISNNVYVKHFPTTWSDDDLKKQFEAYGNILSAKVMTNADGVSQGFGFVCFENKDGSGKAIEAVHEKITVEGQENPLYVVSALKKAEREKILLRKKENHHLSFLKHNLYVRNFPENTSEEELYGYFGQFGELHNVKIMKEAGQSENGERSKGFGFVCFKHPDGAKKAHQLAPQTPLNGRTLYVNYAEKKEIRLIRKEEENDKREFEAYRMQNMMNSSGPMGAGDPMNMMMPMFFQMFQQQMRNFFMQQQRGQMPQARNMRGGHMQRGGGMHRGGRGGYNNQGGYNNNMRNHHQQMPQAPNMGGNFPQGHPGQHQQMMPSQQQPPMQPPMQQPMPTQGAPAGFVDPTMVAQQVPPQQPQAVNMDVAFQQHVIFPIQQQNVFATGDEDAIKEAVGEAIYQFVEQITGEEDAPKVTGMLIDLPIQDLESLISNYANFSIKVNEGLHLLRMQEAAGQ